MTYAIRDNISINQTMFKTDFFSIIIRGSVVLISMPWVFTVLTFNFSEKISYNTYFQSLPALFILMLFLPCFYRIVTQKVSQYLLIINLFPLISYFPLNPFTVPLSLVFSLYLIFLNIYPSDTISHEKSGSQNYIREKEYPVGSAMFLVLFLFIFTFAIFGMDNALLGIIFSSWIFFALMPFYRPVIWMKIFEGLCIAVYFAFELFDIKHHQNLLVNALVKISMPEIILILLSCVTLFLNFLFWLDE